MSAYLLMEQTGHESVRLEQPSVCHLYNSPGFKPLSHGRIKKHLLYSLMVGLQNIIRNGKFLTAPVFYERLGYHQRYTSKIFVELYGVSVTQAMCIIRTQMDIARIVKTPNGRSSIKKDQRGYRHLKKAVNYYYGISLEEYIEERKEIGFDVRLVRADGYVLTKDSVIDIN